MPLKQSFRLFLIFLFLHLNATAQEKLNIKFGTVSAADFEVQSALIDSSTNAVVIADVGKSQFIANTTEFTFSLVFTEKKRIKIINKNGFDAATITIPLYVSDNNKQEKMSDLSAYTYNLEEGKVVATKVEKSSVFSEKHSKNWNYQKFTFPALKEGSIIEYSYQVKSDFFFNLQPWTFQGEYPVLWSQYEASIPEFYKFVVLAQGYQPFFINKVESSQSSFNFVEHEMNTSQADLRGQTRSSSLNNFKVDGKIDHHTWVKKDVPALKEEAYTTTIRNAISKIEFQLNAVAFPHSFPQVYMDSWEKVANDLMLLPSFGVHIDRPNNWLDNDVNSIVGNAGSPKEKTQKIFEYVRDNFTWNHDNGIYVTSGLKDVFKNKSGSAADINMLLIAMLRTQKIPANPVILSTRDHGYTDELYPLIDRYNYVIASAAIGDEQIFMDATAPGLAFGMLPSKVYNGHAREITKEMALPLYFIADSINETNIENVYIINAEKGGLEGSFVHYYGMNESSELRNSLRKKDPEEYKKEWKLTAPEDIKMENIEFDSLKNFDKPVAVKCNLKLNSFGDADIVYFNPMMNAGIKKNPFMAAQRYYPVEMPYTINDVYNLVFEIPKGYKVEELPKSARLTFNEDEGMFEYLISADATAIQMRCNLSFKKANFLNEEYDILRQFYAFIVSKEAEQIVFKKIK